MSGMYCMSFKLGTICREVGDSYTKGFLFINGVFIVRGNGNDSEAGANVMVGELDIAVPFPARKYSIFQSRIKFFDVFRPSRGEARGGEARSFPVPTSFANIARCGSCNDINELLPVLLFPGDGMYL